MPKPSDYDKTHLRNMAAIGTRIDRIFKKAADEAAKIGVQIKSLHPEHLFSFDDYPETKKQIERLMAALQQSTTVAIASGIKQSWALSNNKNNTLAQQVLTDQFDALTEAQRKRYFSTNEAALQAFLQRKTAGLNLSDRVWRYTHEFKEEIELGLDLGIRSGKPAAEMARDLRQYLQHPDMMFRRFRVREENGDAEEGVDKKGYGRKWKRRVTDPVTGKVTWENFNPRDFHPGQGVYRSSYKNARRIAVTETNIAYRTSDHLRWQQMDFVVGIRIVLSNNHTLNGVAFTDICDRLSSTKPGDGKGLYPKDFKFVGWHPHCRCHVETVLKTEEEMEADTQRILNGEPTTTDSVNTVKDTPPEFKEFAHQFNARNEERAANGLRPLNTPYFIRDNRGYFDRAIGLKKTVAQMAAERHAARTPEDIKRIQDAWNAKLERDRLIRKKAEAVWKVAQDFQTDIDSKTWLAMEEAIKSGNLTAMNRMTKPFATDIKALQNRLKALKDAEIIADLQFNHDLWSLIELEKVQASIEKQLANFKVKGYGDFALDTDLDNLKKLKKSLEFQADLAYKNRDKYVTWDVARQSWLQLADKAQNLIEWQPIKAELVSLQGYKTKSPIFADYLAKANDAIAKGDKSLANAWLNQAKVKQAQLEAAKVKKGMAGLKAGTPGGVLFDKSAFTKAEKDNALWFGGKRPKYKAQIGWDEADRYMTPLAQRNWASWNANQREVAHLYTSGSRYINEPLFAHYYGTKYGLDGRARNCWADINTLTDMIDRAVPLPQSMWVQHGEDMGAFEARFGINLNYASKTDLKGLIGHSAANKPFTSAGCAKYSGFADYEVVMNIYCPAGTKGIYTEPFSHYGDGHYGERGYRWDGKPRQDSGYSSSYENEIILQRGSVFRITKIEQKGHKWYVDVELIEQPKKTPGVI